MHIEMAGRNIKLSSYIFSTTRPHELNILCSFQVKYSAHVKPDWKMIMHIYQRERDREIERKREREREREGERERERPIVYQSVFTKEPPGPIPDKGPSPYQAMEDPFITEAGVLKLPQNIKVDKATGPDAIAARVMQETAVDLAPVLTTIFTHSINTD